MLPIPAEPYPFAFEPAACALLIIDMQRDFLEPGGFGESLGNDVVAIAPHDRADPALLEAARGAGHRGHPHARGAPRRPRRSADGEENARQPALRIGDPAPMGRLLVRGEPGHDIIPELYPLAGEPVIDKPGKGAFYATDLDAILKHRGIKQLIVCGVTTEVCVNTTVREANDRGFDCLVLEDCVGSYFPEFQEVGLKMIKAQGGIFGWVGHSEVVVAGELRRGRRRMSIAMPPTERSRAGGFRVTGTASSACSPMSRLT